MQYSRSLLIITGHSGAPVQPMVNQIISSHSDHEAVRPVGNEKALGFRAQDIHNVMASGKAAVVASYDPSATSVLQDWAASEGINTHTVFIKAPQELSFSRAMGNWQQVKENRPMDTLLPDIETMDESELLSAYERGEVSMIDKPHYSSDMAANQMLRRISAIIHSEPMWEDSIAHDNVVDFEPAFGPSVSSMAEQIVSRHAEYAVENGHAISTPDPVVAQEPGVSRPAPNNTPKPRM